MFNDWLDSAPALESVHEFTESQAEYVPGQFFKRELPCILAAIKPCRHQIETIIIDGYVFLADGHAGLGLKLHEALGGVNQVVGVAKSFFHGATEAVKVVRGGSIRPLYVSAVGMDSTIAAQRITEMHGQHRIPTLLKRADSLARGT